MAKRKGGKPKRLAVGIYQDHYGITIRIGGKDQKPRYPVGTPLEELRNTRETLLRAREIAPDSRVRTGTFTAAVVAYLATLTGAHKRDTSARLSHWVAVFGTRALNDIQPIEIRQQLALWRTEPTGARARPFSPQTLRHQRRVLASVYTSANGKSGYNPVREVEPIRVRYTDPRGVDYALIEYILKLIPDRGRPLKGQARPRINHSKIRLRVMAYTGIPPALLRRIAAKDVDLVHGTVLIPQRAKGRGVEAGRVRLVPQAIEAWRTFAAAKLWGGFSVRALGGVWRRAVDRARRAWDAQEAKAGTFRPWPAPADFRAYDLRHSFGTWALAVTGDLAATGELLRHANPATTKRYTLGAVSARVDAAIAKMSAPGSTAGSTPADRKGRKRPPMATGGRRREVPKRRAS